jgi:hypothetical protein
MIQSKYPCPCCGYLVFVARPGSFDICPICFWEDDLSQLRFPTTTGANHLSLILAQQNYADDGVSEPGFRSRVRQPEPSESRDSEWRPIDESKDNIEEPVYGVDYGMGYPEDCTRLYYWRESYWKR